MSHSRRTPCCESEAIRYLQEETLLTTGKEGAWFTVDSLAAAINEWAPKTGDMHSLATAIIQAAKEAE